MANRLTQIATRTGDDGSTGLGDGSRVPKDHLRVQAMGDVDELNSGLGVLLAEPLPDEVRELLVTIQHELFNLGGELSIPGYTLLKADAVLRLDEALAHYNAQLPRLAEFILPAGTRSAALAHVSRTVARRAERAVVALAAADSVNEAPRQYLNRLSDLMFVLARVLNRANLDGLGGDDVYWRSERLQREQRDAQGHAASLQQPVGGQIDSASRKLIAADAPYRRSFIDSTAYLKSSLAACEAIPEADWAPNEFTQALALRMQAWYHAQRQIQAILPKDLAAPASDAFVEAVAFFLRVFLTKAAPHLRVAAERRSGSLRPDVSVLRDDRLIAVIECKTNLGRSRQDWEANFLQREGQLSKLPSSPSVFLLVLTAKNWPGFGDDPRCGKKLFTLLDCWPSDVPLDDSVSPHLVNCIEPLFSAIAQPRP
jgi:cob(I)alamin adenosyltransferase